MGDLFREIIETLDNNGEELLADNILFRSNKLGILSKNLIQEQRYLMSNKVINKYMWITGGVILVNPLPAVDFPCYYIRKPSNDNGIIKNIWN